MVASRHAAGVGKIDRQSPIMNAKIIEINFNPFWTVPGFDHQEGPDPEDAEGAELPHRATRSASLAEGRRRSRRSRSTGTRTRRRATCFRQDPGGDLNSMGFVRINIPNPHGVYMHDTPSKGIFGDDFRFVSSGCVRVQNVRDYITWLLKDTPGWSRDQIDADDQGGAAHRRAARATRSTSTGPTSPPGRRPTASCSSATTSTTATASARSRSRGRSTRSRKSRSTDASAARDEKRPAAGGPFLFAARAAYCVSRRVPMLFAIVWKASISPLASFATKVRSAEPAQSARRFRPCWSIGSVATLNPIV